MVLVSQPFPDLGPDISFCDGDSAIIGTEDQYDDYQWNDNSVNPTFVVKNAGQVWLNVTDEYGCSGADTIMVTVHPDISIDLGPDTILCGDVLMVLDPGSFESYDWSTGEISRSINVRQGAGLISVNVINENGCEAYDEVEIGECSPATLLFIPNTFTPNTTPDGYHDTWDIKNIHLFPDADIQVFDRWGRRVYQSYGGSGDKWDGTFNGKDLPVENYYYIIDLKIPGSQILTGNVAIVR
jgi:gliding motility-associated-like protein